MIFLDRPNNVGARNWIFAFTSRKYLFVLGEYATCGSRRTTLVNDLFQCCINFLSRLVLDVVALFKQVKNAAIRLLILRARPYYQSHGQTRVLSFRFGQSGVA